MYLYPKIDEIADSTFVINEEFQFKGNLSRPRLAHLRIIESRDDKTFWLENRQIDFIAEKGNFSKGRIRGSETQKESEMLLKRKDSIFKEMEKLEAKVTEKNRDSLFEIYEKMQNIEIEINNKFIQEYPNSYESLTRLNWSKERMGSEETAIVFSYLNSDLNLIYIDQKNGTPNGYAIPISGKGLWSTLYGYFAVEPDGITAKGITFYAHKETPGLGGEVDKPWFQNNFIGKKFIEN